MFGKILCLTLMVGVALAATAIGRPPQKPANLADKEGCFVKALNDVIPYGAVVTPVGTCYSISCGREIMHYASCGVVYTDDPKCYITEIDLKTSYPACCPTIKCDIDNNLI